MSREKQIEEMERIIQECDDEAMYASIADSLYDSGYRKQKEGEWKIKSEIHQMLDDVDEELYVECPFCQRKYYVPYEFEDEKIFKYAREHYPYCNCGAKMKGGAE